MKRTYAVAGILLILAATFVIEHYTNTRFPTQEYPLVGVPELEIGKTHSFTYAKALDQVGTYSYTISGKTGGVYTMESVTDVTFEGETILLESTFLFDEQYKPKDYMLIVEQGGESNIIHVEFIAGEVVSEVTLENETITLSDEFPSSGFMTENNMPGVWEILLLSGDLEQGARYSAMAYIPQGGAVFELEFYVQSDTQNVFIDGEQVPCMVVQESTLDLRFYLSEGRLVQMRNDDQDLVFTRIN